MNRKISCVIPVFNRSELITSAINSVLAQGDMVGEVLIIDDGSTDDLTGKLAPFADNITLIQHGKNLGVAAARNTAIARAKMDYIAFLDSDDIWLKGKLKSQLDFMEMHDLDVSCTGFQTSFSADQAQTAYRPYPPVLTIDHMLWGCYTAPGSTLMARKSVLRDAGGYDTQFIRYEDWDLLLRLALTRNVKIGFLNPSLANLFSSGAPPVGDAYLGLERIRSKHLETISKLGDAKRRKFLSGLLFNRASLEGYERKPVSQILSIIRSLAMWPKNNQCFELIAFPRIQQRLAATFNPSRPK